MKQYFTGFFTCLFMFMACGVAPSIVDRIIDVDHNNLRADKPEDDLSLDYCKINICYGYKDEDVRKLKKYIVELEDRLKECEAKP